MTKVASHLDQFSICDICDTDTWHVTVSVLDYVTKDVIRYELQCEECLLSFD